MRPSLLSIAVLLLPAAAWSGPPPSTPPGLQESIRFVQVPERMELPALDLEKVRAEDAKDRAEGKPPRYARLIEVSPVTPSADGVWETLADGTRVWRYRVKADGATSVQPAFTAFHLPEGAALYVHGFDGKRVRGPYTHEHNAGHGELWVPIIEGDRATIELVLEPGVAREAVTLEMTRVLHGYNPFWKRDVGTKDTNSCNVDVACEEADGWRDQIASVALVTVSTSICSGQMVNDTAFSGRPLFLTANHCGLRESNAASVNVYWNFEHPECRDISDSPTPRTQRGDGTMDHAQTGARLLARYRSSDFALLELSRNPEPEWDVYWTGWDRRDQSFSSGTGIHHPRGEEKRISFEDDPLDIVDGSDLIGLPSFNESDARSRSHLEVNDWDLGVTEGGSSGSGLWNGRRLLVGQLHGGASHQCDDQDFDWYGRFWMSWEGGGTVDSSLEPWLDPLGTGDKMQQGRDGACSAPDVGIADNVTGPVAGEPFTLSAGGGGPAVQFLWDVDGDGIMDAEGRDASVRFADAGEREVRLTASNPGQSCGTTVSKTVTVRAAELQVTDVSEPVQLSGDNDGVMEPGERWSLKVTVANTGTARAANPRAVFLRPGAGLESVGPDGFGYTATSSLISSACPFQFVDIADGNAVNFQPVNENFPGEDDGGSGIIELDGFEFYGSDVQAVVMSSNGYLAPSAARNGGDFDNDCPLPARVDGDPSNDPATGHARLAAHHDDLVTNSAFQQRLDPCPRRGAAPGSDGACQVFQWNDVDVLPEEGPFVPLPLAEFDFQAILYEGSSEIVYQYGPDMPTDLSTPTVGIQNNSATRGLTWGCGEAGETVAPVRPAANSAVCFYHPDSQPSAALDQAVANLLTPGAAFKNPGGNRNIPAGGTATATLEFAIDEDAPCGADFTIGLHGVIHDGLFSAGPGGGILSARVGGEEARCDAGIKAASAKADIDFTPGMYFNPARDGHGVDIHTAGDQAFLVWFTYGPDRQPVWYFAQGAYEENQVIADLLRFTDDSRDDPETVGQVIVTFLDEASALFSWTLDGEPGGEAFQYLKAGGEAPPKQPTGHWFPPSQSGWGMTFNAQGDTEFGVVYFYDDQDQPVWALGVKDAPAGQTIDLLQFKGVCPGCDWAPQSDQAAGSLERTFTDAENGTVETDITLGPPLEGDWPRGPVNIRILSDPID